MDIGNYGLEKAYAEQAQTLAIPGRPYNPNLTERLEMQIKDAEERLARLKEAHAALKAQPEFETLLNLLQRV